MSQLVRKQVYITHEQEQLLKSMARREEKSEAEILRSALDQALRPRTVTKNRPKRDPLWDIVGLGRTKAGNVALDVDLHLYGVSKR